MLLDREKEIAIMKVLELFAGTRSIGKAFEAKGHKVFSVEWNKDFENIDLNIDIGKLQAQEILDKFGKPDVIWCSPDCSSYSIAAISHHRIKEPSGNLAPKSDYAKFCDNVNAHVLELIKELNPKYWFIENPRGGLRKMDFMQSLPRKTVTYCQYNERLVQELIFNMKTKKCPKCGKTKDIGEFYKCKTRRDGFTSWCKDCSNESHKKYTKNNVEHLREYGRERYAKDPEKFKIRKKRCYIKNKDSINKAKQLYYKNNKEKVLDKSHEYYQNNKELISSNNHNYYLNNTKYFKDKAKNRKRVVRHVSDGTITPLRLNKMYEDQEHKCAYCGCNLDLEKNIKNLDHILPIARGGKHTLNNVQWTCQKCNKSKKDKTEEEWLKKERMKPTDLWTNHSDPKFKPMCHNGDSCHVSAPRGSKTGTQGLKGSKERSVIPRELCDHIVEICEEKTKTKPKTMVNESIFKQGELF